MASLGWFKTHRELINKPIWHLSTPEQKCILITLLCLASHEENEWEWMGQKFKVLPGQFVTSLDSIKKATGKGISIQNVRSSLDRFKKLQFLTYEATKAGRVISICNWESYQHIEKATQQRKEQTGNKGATGIKNVIIIEDNISVTFEAFRKKYPGNKRGLQTELDGFLKKNSAEVIPLLLPALEMEITYREKLKQTNKFLPDWKNLSTWINQKCWEQEFSEINSTVSNTNTKILIKTPSEWTR